MNKINLEEVYGVEKEDLGSPKITSPYDPDKIKIDQQNVNLGYLIEMLENDEIDLMPDFQRSMDLWDATQKSQLIESLLLGLPLPSFYFSADDKTEKWLVVDGLQRLCTFRDFIVKKNLSLTGLEFLNDFDGKTYNDLSREEKRKISGAKINFYVIEKQTPSNVKFLIFKRVNTGGLVLTPQEMRHALNQGIPSKFIKELAEVEEFKTATCGSVRTKRMEDRDFANRFVAFYLLGYEDSYDGELDKFLNDGMERLASIDDDERYKIKKVFTKSMKLSFDIFGDDAFRKRYDINETRRRPISKAVYDTISVNLAWLDNAQRNVLKREKEKFRSGLIALFNDDTFHRSITTATGQKSNVKTRFEKIKNLIQEILES
ncbi:MAG: DUF262 domain-containing protein [Desulfobacterales bacterium]|nr:DUF262 domain-containing protein [Desulfobacterales bacterium]